MSISKSINQLKNQIFNINIKSIIQLFIILLLSIIPFQFLLIHDIIKINKHQYQHINNLYKITNNLKLQQLRNQRNNLRAVVIAKELEASLEDQAEFNYTSALVMSSVMTEVLRHDQWRIND